MASSSAVGGLVSGLDTKTLVSQLVSLAGATQTRLKAQLSANSSQTTAAQSINAKAASMTSAAKDLAAAKTFTTATATSSSTTVTASATGSPAASQVSFTVTRLATAASYSSGPLTFPSSVTAGDVFTITRDGVDHEVPKATTAAQLVANINDSDAGVLATVVTDSANAQRLVITSATTGEDLTLAVTGLGDTGGLRIGDGRSALVDLGGGITVTSRSNTVTGLIAGVDITLGTASDAAGVVTVSTAVSTTTVADKVTGLVAAMNAVLDDVAFHTKALAAGVKASSTSGGLLAGNSIMRSVASTVLDAVSSAQGPDSAALAGLGVTRSGDVTFDTAVFTALHKSDPERAERILTAFATAVQNAGDLASNAESGSVTAFITGTRSDSQMLTESIAAWDTRLAVKREQLTAQYTAMETALSKLNSQMTALETALNSLPGWTND